MQRGPVFTGPPCFYKNPGFTLLFSLGFCDFNHKQKGPDLYPALIHTLATPLKTSSAFTCLIKFFPFGFVLS